MEKLTREESMNATATAASCGPKEYYNNKLSSEMIRTKKEIKNSTKPMKFSPSKTFEKNGLKKRRN